jgi:Family of unknown function (DUF6152)
MFCHEKKEQYDGYEFCARLAPLRSYRPNKDPLRRIDMRKSTIVVVILAAFMLTGAISAFAHHSFAATYNVDKKITLEGKVVQMMMRNPHSFIHIEVMDENGKPVTWSIEGGGTTQMKNGQGEPLRVGDKVQVVCNPGRSVEGHRGRLVSITRPSDGWTWGTRAGEVVE